MVAHCPICLGTALIQEQTACTASSNRLCQDCPFGKYRDSAAADAQVSVPPNRCTTLTFRLTSPSTDDSLHQRHTRTHTHTPRRPSVCTIPHSSCPAYAIQDTAGDAARCLMCSSECGQCHTSHPTPYLLPLGPASVFALISLSTHTGPGLIETSSCTVSKDRVCETCPAGRHKLDAQSCTDCLAACDGLWPARLRH